MLVRGVLSRDLGNRGGSADPYTSGAQIDSDKRLPMHSASALCYRRGQYFEHRLFFGKREEKHKYHIFEAEYDRNRQNLLREVPLLRKIRGKRQSRKFHFER